MAAPTHLDLFSGIGGFALAAQWAGFRTIGFCEIDKYCQKVLAKNFMAYPASWRLSESEFESGVEGQQQIPSTVGTFPCDESPPRIFANIFDFDGTAYRGVDLITAGFPCQPFSVAGKRAGKEDDRYLWPPLLKVIEAARPVVCLLENVPGIIPMELDNVLSDLEGIGYATRAFVIPACAVDARHRRDRVWIVANTIDNSDRTWRGQNPEANGIQEVNRQTLRGGLPCGTGQERDVADYDSKHSQEQFGGNQLGEAVRAEASRWSDAREGRQWEPEPNVGRVAHGIPNRVHRLKGLGNSIVPQVAYELLREIRKLI